MRDNAGFNVCWILLKSNDLTVTHHNTDYITTCRGGEGGTCFVFIRERKKNQHSL